jgi:hypothetical protein
MVVNKAMDKPKLEAAVGMSRKWDAREAGREVAESTLSKLNGNPNFFLLFSTIHYEKHGGFEEFLKGVWEILPESTPLIGGSVVGFMNNHGCYTRGSSALAVSYPNMDVSIGVGHNTKRNPEKAAMECADMIKNDLEKSNYSNKFLIDITSSGIVPNMPGIGRKKVIRSKFGDVLLKTLNTTCKRLQIGPGREDEIIDILSKELSDYDIIGGSTLDDNKWERNFQFYKKEVLTNSVIALGFKTDLNWKLNSTFGLNPTGIKMRPSKTTLFDCAIKKIENKPAVDAYLEKMGWSEDLLDENMHRRTLFYPICYKKGEMLCPRVLALVIKDALVFTNKALKDKDMEVYSASGSSLINSVKQNLDKYEEDNLKFGFIVSCCARLEALGDATFKVHEIINNYYKNIPFLLFFASGEDVYKSGKTPVRLNESFNVVNFY